MCYLVSSCDTGYIKGFPNSLQTSVSSCPQHLSTSKKKNCFPWIRTACSSCGTATMIFTVCIRYLEIIFNFTGWVCLFFRHTASRCPSFWQYRHVRGNQPTYDLSSMFSGKLFTLNQHLLFVWFWGSDRLLSMKACLSPIYTVSFAKTRWLYVTSCGGDSGCGQGTNGEDGAPGFPGSAVSCCSNGGPL